MTIALQQESLEALELELFKINFKESSGARLVPIEVKYRLKLMQAIKRLRKEMAAVVVLEG